MPDWNDLLDEIKETGSTYDIVRRQYLTSLHAITGRNTILYYSGWLQKTDLRPGTSGISDSDKIGFMTTIHGLDRSKGLDLVLHTPGGEMAATESIVQYLRDLFGTDIRAIVPQLAMSGGTMIACACKTILMGKQSSLGPIDPQYKGILPAHGVIEEFEDAQKSVKSDPSTIPIWQQIFAKYSPTMVGECRKAIAWANDMVKQWLETGMFEGEQDASTKAEAVVAELSDHSETKSHSRHLSAARCLDIGLKIDSMEDNQELQDAILTLHHACVHTLTATPAFKIIENHEGKAFIQQQRLHAVPTQMRLEG